MFKHILVPTDGSPLSQEAVTRAISFAKEAGARITFFCAVQPAPKMYYGEAIFDSHTFARFREKMLDSANDILDAAESIAGEAGIECRKVALVSEEPYEAIIEAATRNECDLIFMASHGRRGVSGLLLGSETQKVLTHSTIPVLVHRSDCREAPY
ncbi:universal stress protein [Geobacter grbiciae]|uniref:universal stress protein n=1 Tax=Geobacter grbiciae TaxID=155042 RepID=UPI001C02DF6D|nr:universal stress protein [Geobacter grbiciae]MBT1075430.1 universal stress protein [Geobacter grbiciae]